MSSSSINPADNNRLPSSASQAQVAALQGTLERCLQLTYTPEPLLETTPASLVATAQAGPLATMPLGLTDKTVQTPCSTLVNHYLQQARQGLALFDSPFCRENPLPDVLNYLSQAQEALPVEAVEIHAQVAGLLAGTYWHLGQWELAVQHAHKALVLMAKQPQAHWVLAQHALQHQHAHKALGYLKAAPQKQSANWWWAYSLSLEAVNQTRPTGLTGGFQLVVGACQTLRLKLAQQPASHWASLTLSSLHLLGLQLNKKPINHRMQKLLQLHQQWPGYSFIMEALADGYQLQGQDAEAIFWYKQCLERRPAQPAVLEKLGNLYQQMGQTQLLSPSGQTLAQEALLEAHDCFSQLAQCQPAQAEPYCHLGNVAFLLERYAQAAEAYQNALSLSQLAPQGPVVGPHAQKQAQKQSQKQAQWAAQVAKSLGELYHLHLKNPQAAQTSYLWALSQWQQNKIHPQHWANESETALQLASLYLDQQQPGASSLVAKQALERLNTLVEESADWASETLHQRVTLLAHLGFVAWTENRIDEACHLYKEALKEDSSYDVGHNNLGVLLMDHFGRLQEAKAHFEQAAALNNQYAMAYYNLGRVYTLLNQKPEAAASFEQAKHLNQQSCELDPQELQEQLNALFDLEG